MSGNFPCVSCTNERMSDEYENDDEVYHDFDIVMRISTQSEADTYVSRALNDASAELRERVFQSFEELAVTSVAGMYEDRDVRSDKTVPLVRVQSGGDAQSQFYALLQLIDSLKDFGDKVPAEHIQQAFRVELPIITKTRDNVEIVEQMKLAEMYGPDNTLLQDITSTAQLQFPNGAVYDNPLHNHNFEQGMFVFDSRITDCLVDDQILLYKETNPPCKDCTNLEVWSFVEDELKILKVEQIVHVVAEITKMYGVNAKFIVDESAPLTRLVLSMKMIYKSFLQSFRIQWLDKKQTMEWIQWWNVWSELTKNWRCMTCDAGLMDAEPHAFDLHPAPTGDIFEEGSPVQISLISSSETVNGRKVERQYTYEISSDCSPVDFNHPGTNTVTKSIINDKYNGIQELYSINSVVTTIASRIDVGMNIAVPLALKLAGDWGQVEHCKKYDMVFVTSDKLAALYAIYRDVCVIYVNTWRVPDKVWDEYDTRDLYRHSFALCGSDNAQARLVRPRRPTSSMVAGGGSSMVSRNLALAMVTIAMAVIGSL